MKKREQGYGPGDREERMKYFCNNEMESFELFGPEVNKIGDE